MKTNIIMSIDVINLKHKFSKFKDLWSPKVIGELNNYQFKLVKIKTSVIINHDTDEAFIVIEAKYLLNLLIKLLKLIKEK